MPELTRRAFGQLIAGTVLAGAAAPVEANPAPITLPTPYAMGDHVFPPLPSVPVLNTWREMIDISVAGDTNRSFMPTFQHYSIDGIEVDSATFERAILAQNEAHANR